MNSLKTLISAAVIGAALVQPAAALEPLSQEKYINDRLIAARIADRIRKTCPTIGARIFYAYGQARQLQSYARKKGYSDAQIDSFLDSKQEKKRIYAVAEDYLARNGAKKDDPESFCKIGRAEIKKNTVIGSLLAVFAPVMALAFFTLLAWFAWKAVTKLRQSFQRPAGVNSLG